MVNSFRIICSAILTLLLSYAAYFFYETYTFYSSNFILNFPDTANVSDKLSDLQFVSTAPYHGCESIVYHEGALYTGAAEGKILKMNESGVFVFAELGSSACASSHACGRPLGMRLSLDRTSLVVVDAYLGLFSVSLIDGTNRKLFPLKNELQVSFFNDFDILPNGTIIFSESSTDFSLEDIMQIIFTERPNGRILSLDLNTGKWRQIMSGLAFANGVQLHRDGRSVLVAETITGRVYRLPLDGGRPSLFGGELPGLPDNIRPSARGGYWVPVSNLKNTFFSHLTERLRQWTIIKRILSMVAKFPLFDRLRLTKSTMLLRLDDDGNVVEVLRDPLNRVRNVAEVCEHENVLYTGSYFLPHMGRLQL